MTDIGPAGSTTNMVQTSTRQLSLAPYVLLVIATVTLLPVLVQARRTAHCFTCRSRGQLGDCRDPFPYNETTAEGVRGVEVTPCASKWCGKLIEGRDDDFDLATERMCLQRPPDDQEERCAETLYQNRRVYMCFCRGDICNAAHSSTTSGSFVVMLVVAAWTLYYVALDRQAIG